MNTERKFITRIVGDRVSGWYVRIPTDLNQEHQKLFSDGVFGGEDEALKAAQTYRDEFLAENPLPERTPFRKTLPVNNKTGIVGVHWSTCKSGTRRNSYDVAVASWMETVNGRRVGRSKRFYLHHYDTEEECLQDAADYRAEKELEMLEEWKANGREGYSFYNYGQ